MEHPLALFLFALANVTSGVGFIYLGLFIIARARLELLVAKVAGIVMMCGSGVAHIMLALMALFAPGTTAGAVAERPLVLVLHTLIASGMWVFLLGVFLQIGRFGALPPHLIVEPSEDETTNS